MRPLFEITQDMKKLQDILDLEADVANDPDSGLAFADWAKGLAEEQEKKLDGYVAVIKQLEMEAAAATAEMEQWKMKANSRKAQAQWLKDKMREHMVAVGVDELTTERGYRICLQQNGGQVPVLYDDGAIQNMTDAELGRFVEDVPSVNKTEVRKALEAGEELSFARLGHPGKHVRVRT